MFTVKINLVKWPNYPRQSTDSMSVQFSSVQSLSRVWLFVTPWIAACQVSLSITNSWTLPKLKSIKSVTPSSQLILCHPLLLLPSIPQCNPYQKTKGIFHRTITNNSNIFIEIERSWIVKIVLRKNNRTRGLIPSDF